MCDKTYLLVDSIGKFCADNAPPTHLIVKTSSVIMAFATSSEVSGRGVNITITSVGNNSFVFIFRCKLLSSY